jgi:hypothetical protein
MKSGIAVRLSGRVIRRRVRRGTLPREKPVKGEGEKKERKTRILSADGKNAAP